MQIAFDEPVLSRVRLLDRLHARAARIVSIVAPAGFGKTTLAQQFAATFVNDAVCDCSDVPDVAEFGRRLIQSLAQHDPQRGAGPALEQVPAIGTVDDFPAVAVSAWSRASAPAVVLFENGECLADIPLVGPLLRRLILGHRRAIVICARREIPLPFGHGVGPGDVAMIGASELAFTRAEANLLLGEIAESDLDRAMALTDGWPLALSMIARMCRGEQLSAVLERVGARRTEELNQYLMTQFVDHLEPAALETLVASAAIPQPTVGEISAALGRDCSRTLAELRTTLPLALVADKIELHPLLRAMLRERFARRGTQIVRETIHSAERARDHTRTAELYLALGEHRAAAAEVQDVGPYLLSTPSRRVSSVVASLDDRILMDFPMLWCSAMLYRGYAIPPEEGLREASAIWARLDPAGTSSTRTSVASCVLNAYTNMGRCAEAAAFLAEFERTTRPEDREAAVLAKLWGAALKSLAGRYTALEEITRELAPVLAASHLTHAFYLCEVLAPMYRTLGQRSVEYRTLERGIELGAGSDIATYSVIPIEAAFGAWFAGEDAEFARYLAQIEAKITPSIVRGHRFFIACARGNGLTAQFGYETLKARAEGLLIAVGLAANIFDARELARRAVDAADAGAEPFFRALARLAWAEVDAENSVSLRLDAQHIGASVEAPVFRSAVDAVVTGQPNVGMLAPFIARFVQFSGREPPIELRLFDGVLSTDHKIVPLAESEYVLLAGLAREDRWHSGPELAAELFPELDESAALNRVYVCLHRFRKRFGESTIVLAGRHGYRLAPELSVDVWEVTRLLSRAATTGWAALTLRERRRLDDVALHSAPGGSLPPSLEQRLSAGRRRVRIELARQHQARGEHVPSVEQGDAGRRCLRRKRARDCHSNVAARRQSRWRSRSVGRVPSGNALGARSRAERAIKGPDRSKFAAYNLSERRRLTRRVRNH